MLNPGRTRSDPRPPLLALLLLTFLGGPVLLAHDPGLSALEIHVAGDRLSALLSIAAADLELPADGLRLEPKAMLGDLGRSGVRLWAGTESLPPRVDDVIMEEEEEGGRVRLSFERPRSATRLRLRSDVPARLARGHRQLVVVLIEDRVVAEQLLDAGGAEMTIELAAPHLGPHSSATRLLGLGFQHILAGYDHLVFLAGLLLVSRSVRDLVTALTAFTAAHSLTLAIVIFGSVHVTPQLVEPAIAASIAWIGLENLFGRRQGARWIVVFGFGLIHGFGFAEALAQLGLGSSGVGAALGLLSFNAGVELGQLAVAAAVLPVVWTIRRRPLWNARIVPLCSTAIVLAGGYWLIDRLH